MGVDTIRPSRAILKQKPSRHDLINREGDIGGRLFGPIPEGCTRKFYNQDHDTWVWYEEWTDEAGLSASVTTRYEIHPSGVLKDQDGAPKYYIQGRELNSFLTATQLYYERVAREIYHRDPATGNLLTT